ncbi:putative polyprotein, partial [Globisporangium splendens]
MEGVETPMGTMPTETVELTNEHFPHLSSHEWAALERMRAVIGEAAAISLLRSASPDEQRNAATSFMHHEIMNTHRQPATPVTTMRVAPLKLDVSPHRGGENEPLARWFVELDAAITARQLRDPSQQVLFAMSNLADRAKSWAYGKRLADLNCFPSYDHVKTELKKAFEPPQSEFRARAEFLELRQSRFDLHSYAQRARYLVSSIVDEPIDVPTQVVTSMTGLNDGPIRNQLFREYPKTLDEAIERAMQEEFSIKQAKFHGFASRPMRQLNVAHDGPEPMDISYISTPGNERPRNDGKCFRCGKPCHIARNCKVSLPGRQTTQGARSNNHDRSYGLGEGPPTGPEKRTVDVVETQDSGPYVHQAHAVSTMSEKSVSQTSSLIVHKVHVDGIATPLRALVDTGASNNFVRNEVIVRHGVFVPDAYEEKTMIVRLANGSTVKMPKRVVRLAIKCEDFRGEDEFILLDLDDKFDIILGMPWLKRYQPSIDWMNMKISVGKSRDVDLCSTTTDEVVWVYTSVEEIPDDPCDIAVCDGPPCSQVVPILKKMNGGGAVRRQKKTVSFAIDEKVRDGVDKSGWKRNKHPSQQDKKKTSKRSFSPRVLSTPDEGTSGDDEGSAQAQDTPSEFVNIAVYNEEGDVDVIRHVKIENPPSSVEELISLQSMSKKTLERSLARGDIAQCGCRCVGRKDTEGRFEEQSWDALKKNPVYALAREYEDIFPDKVPDELPFDRGIRHEIDVLPGTKYCITRQWPLPKEQVEAINEFFAQRAEAGHVRESKSPHCSPTFCVKKATGGWRIVHALNKLNDATIPAQTPVPRKDMILDGMVGSTVFSAIDLKDGFYYLSEQFTFHSAMKRPSDQVNREERPSSKRQQTAPELFDISPILKKKGELEFYKERFFSWHRINDRDDPNQHIAAQRDSWRTFVRLENENKMERLLRRGNARAERRTPADDRANPSSGRRSVAPGDATSSSHSCGSRREHQTPMSDEAPTCPSSVDIHATELCRSVEGSTASFLDDESVDLRDEQSTQPPSDALPESLTTGSAHRGQIEALQQRCSTLEERCESLENLVADHESKIDVLTEGSAQCSALESRFEERFQQVQDELVRLQKNEKSRELAHDRLLRSVEEAGSALEVLRGEYHSRLQALEAVKDQSFDVLQLLYAEKNLQSDELFALRNQV